MPTEAEVFVVDDDPDVRTALERVIASAGHRVRTFGTAHEFLASQCHRRPGCLVLDLRLPDVDGIELYRRLRESGARLPVIFLTGFADVRTGVDAMKSGAVDFLPKPVRDETLLNAIESGLAAERRQRQERVEVEELARRYASLTPRERDVCSLVLAGLLNKQIARQLKISEKTVKVHRGRVMAKMGVRRVAELARLAFRLGIAIPDQGPTPTLPAPAARKGHVALGGGVSG